MAKMTLNEAVKVLVETYYQGDWIACVTPPSRKDIYTERDMRHTAELYAAWDTLADHNAHEQGGKT